MVPKKIFIVDDDPMLTEALSDYLTRKIPHSIQSYPTGEDALSHITEKPDIVILDFHLNTVQKNARNGLEILKEIRKINPGQRVIMLSSQEQFGVAAQTIQRGAEQYIIKDEKEAFAKIAGIVNG